MLAAKHCLAIGGLFAGAALCMALGGWQWSRGIDKAQIQGRLKSGQDSLLGWRSLADSENGQYRRFELSGQYLPARQFLLTHRVHRQQMGYEVLTPFLLAESEQLVVIDRGWLSDRALASLPGIDPAFPGLASRVAMGPRLNASEQAYAARALDPLHPISGADATGSDGLAGEALDTLYPPSGAAANGSDGPVGKALDPLHTPGEGAIKITGIGVPYFKGFRIGHNQQQRFEAGSSDLHPLLYRDSGDIEDHLQAEVAPLMLVLDAKQPGALEYSLKAQTMTPGRHYSYAVQWLIFSTLQLVIAVVYWRRQTAAAASGQ